MSSSKNPDNFPQAIGNMPLARLLAEIILFPVECLSIIIIMPLSQLLKRFNYKMLDFARLNAANKIDVVTNFNEKVKSIGDENIVTEVIEFIENHSDRWYTPLYGVPVCSLSLVFLSGEDFIGRVGISQHGLEFFPVIRELKKEEGKQLYVLMGIEDQS